MTPRYGGGAMQSKYGRRKYYNQRYKNTLYRFPDKKTQLVPKFIDVTNAGTPATTVGTFILLNGVLKGTDANQRVGSKFKMLSEQLKIQFLHSVDGSGNFVDCTVRYLIIHDTETNGLAPVMGDIFVNTSATVVTLSPLNLDNNKRFRIIADVTQELDHGHGENFYNPIYKKVALDTSNYNANNLATFAGISEGSLFLLVLSDQLPGGLGGFPPNFNYYNRVRFIDQ